MTANTTYTVSLTDLDAVLPEEFEILQPPQANVDAFTCHTCNSPHNDRADLHLSDTSAVPALCALGHATPSAD